MFQIAYDVVAELSGKTQDRELGDSVAGLVTGLLKLLKALLGVVEGSLCGSGQVLGSLAADSWGLGGRGRSGVGCVVKRSSVRRRVLLSGDVGGLGHGDEIAAVHLEHCVESDGDDSVGI